MPVATTIALVGLAITAAGTYSQIQAQKKQQALGEQQARAQQRQADLEKKRADIQNARTLRSSLRQSRIAQGSLVNAGANTGAGLSSGVQGGLASIGAQTGVNEGQFVQQGAVNEAQLQTSTEISSLNAAMGKAQGQAAIGGSVAGAGQQIFSGGGGFKTLFGT